MLNFHIRKVTLKSGDIRYRTVITRSGKAIKTKTFRRKSDARIYGNRLVIEFQEHEAKGVTPCTVGFYRLADEYMHWWTGKDHDRSRLVNWWTNQLGNILLTDITLELIREKLKPKKSLAPATYNKHLVVISSILNFATLQQEDEDITEHYIDENPCKRVRRLVVNNKRVRYLSDDEKTRLLKEVKIIGGKLFLAMIMALTTGMRKSELMNLRWSDIDFDRGLAMLEKTKNGSRRHTPIPDIVMEKLIEVREVGNGLVFPAPHNGDIPVSYTRQWKAVLKNANITDFRWHDMRHDTASTLARDGKTLKEIAEILGHKSLASTDRYTHLCTEHKSRILNETMNKSISGVGNG
ncbi:MAG: tyrosine-type recombinase/integrase [Methylococcaceae bacterium]|nr:tyrosine-type recombinase/integrase [Methylococcaceae bacterium]